MIQSCTYATIQNFHTAVANEAKLTEVSFNINITVYDSNKWDQDRALALVQE